MPKASGGLTREEYKQKNRDYFGWGSSHPSALQLKHRALKNSCDKARQKLMKAGKVRVGDGKDVDHKDHNPANNSRDNLRVRSASANRADNRHKTRPS